MPSLKSVAFGSAKLEEIGLNVRLIEAGSCAGCALSSSVLSSKFCWPGSPGMRLTFFCFAKKSKQKKATRSLGPYASLRATCGARLRRGLAQTRLRLKQARSLIRLRLRSSAQPGRGNRERRQNTKNKPRQTRTRQGESLWFSVFGFGIPSPPLVDAPRSGGPDGSGIALSERSEFSETPAGPSTAGCPQRSGGTQQPGSPFLLLTFLLAKQKKSELPPGNPRPAELRRGHTPEQPKNYPSPRQ
jgi:hypothetical protein